MGSLRLEGHRADVILHLFTGILQEQAKTVPAGDPFRFHAYDDREESREIRMFSSPVHGAYCKSEVFYL